MKKAAKGFTLLETLLYVAILAIVSGLFVGILTTSTRVGIHEASSSEVSQQTNFALQTIQRLVRESSVVIVGNASTCTLTPDTDATPLGTAQPCLKLRMRDSAGNPTDRDPIYIWGDKNEGKIKIAQGTNAPSDLTTDKVTVPTDGLTFTKFSNYPSRDIVQVDLTLNFNTTNPAAAFSKHIITGIGRADAATFDSDLLPGGTYNVGLDTSRWENLFVNNLNVANTITESTNNWGGTNGAQRGFMPIGTAGDQNCSQLCGAHGLTCNVALGPFNNTPGSVGRIPCNSIQTGTKLCLCN